MPRLVFWSGFGCGVAGEDDVEVDHCRLRLLPEAVASCVASAEENALVAERAVACGVSVSAGAAVDLEGAAAVGLGRARAEVRLPGESLRCYEPDGAVR